MNIGNLVAKVITVVFVVMTDTVTMATLSTLVSLVTSAMVMLAIRVVCKFMQVLMYSAYYFCQILIKFEFS